MTSHHAGAAGLIVRAAGQSWAIPVAAVIEVLRGPRVVRMPGAGAAVRGVVNHRGRIITVADVVAALGLPGSAASATDLVVVEAAGHRFAVALEAVVELSPEARTGLAELDLSRIASAIFG